MKRIYSDFDYEVEKKLTAFCQKHGSYKYSPGENASMKCIACQNEHMVDEYIPSIYEDCIDNESKFIKSGVESSLFEININNMNEHVNLLEKQNDYLRNYVNNFNKLTSKNLVINAVNFNKLNVVSAAITLSLVKDGVNVAYAKNFNFFNKIRESNNFKSDSYENSRRIYQNADLLIVDNFSPKFLSDFQRAQLQSLINHRYGNLLPTIFLTTFNVEKFFNLVGERVEAKITSNYDFMNI